MKLRGITSVLAAGVAVSLVWLVGASGEEQPLEAIPAPAAIQAPPAPGADRALESVREAFGEDFADPLGADHPDTEELQLPGNEFLTFDPYNAPTPEVIQPDGSTDAAVLVPLPTAPATIATTTVESVGEEKKGALLSQPVKGRSTSRFGMRFHPVLRVYKLHTGHDWAAPCGTPVGAAAAGTVVRTGWAGGNGVQVKIDHGMLKGYRVVTTYNHLSSIGVKVGQKVKALQGIGRVGNTGYSTGCHLHFEVIVNGQFTNPIPWLNGEATVVDLSEMDNIIIPTVTPSVQPTLPDATEQPTLPVSPLPSGTPTDPSATPTPGDPGTPPSGTPTDPGTPEPTTPTPTTPAPTTPSDPPSGTPSDPPSGTPTNPTTPVDPPTTPPEETPTEPPTQEPTTPPATTPPPTTPPAPPPTTSQPAPPPTTDPDPGPTQTATDPDPAPTQTSTTPAQQDPPPTTSQEPSEPPADD